MLKMKTFDIFGIHWKIWLLGGFTKNQYRGRGLKRGLGQFADLRKGLGKNSFLSVFLSVGGRGGGGLIPQCTLCNFFSTKYENITLIGNFNIQPGNKNLKNFCDLNKLSHTFNNWFNYKKSSNKFYDLTLVKLDYQITTKWYIHFWGKPLPKENL